MIEYALDKLLAHAKKKAFPNGAYMKISFSTDLSNSARPMVSVHLANPPILRSGINDCHAQGPIKTGSCVTGAGRFWTN